MWGPEPVRGVEDRVSCDGASRTVSGPDGSSTKGNPPGAARVPGLSYLQAYRPEVCIRRQVHGLLNFNRLPANGEGGFLVPGKHRPVPARLLWTGFSEGPLSSFFT